MLDEEFLRKSMSVVTEDEARFWTKVNIVDDSASCWEWHGASTKEGYGQFRWEKRSIGAHRVAFVLTYGFMPETTCHTCDNPPCCRPSHLFAGTPKMNVRDMDAKGRRILREQRGEDNPYAKLTDAGVLEIRDRAAGGESDASIAEGLGVQAGTITAVVLGKTWKHVGGPVQKRGRPKGKLTLDQAVEILQRLAAGETRASIALAFEVSASTISLIANGKVWKEAHAVWVVTPEEVSMLNDTRT